MLKCRFHQSDGIVGNHNRFDKFRLEFDLTPNRPIWTRNPPRRGEQPPDEPTQVSQDAEIALP